MRKYEWEGKEIKVILLLQEMLKDNGWSQKQIDDYILARI